jgi:cytochrome c556
MLFQSDLKPAGETSMQRIRKTLLAGLVGLALGSAGTAQAGFSFGDSNFSFGDDDDWWGPGWGNPYLGGPYGRPGWGDPRWGNGGTGRGWGPGYGPWGPGPYGMPPRLGSFDRTKMRLDRQRQMSNHDDAMEELGDMLYGRYNFDREKAIELAREIESGAGMALVRNFHPGSIATDESHTTPAFWGNEATFKANADALKTAATALAEELAKRPTDEEGAVYSDHGRGDEPVSPDIWEKFHDVANSCRACHATFRGPKW